jgi:hypothetical protein
MTKRTWAFTLQMVWWFGDMCPPKSWPCTAPQLRECQSYLRGYLAQAVSTDGAALHCPTLSPPGALRHALRCSISTRSRRRLPAERARFTPASRQVCRRQLVACRASRSDRKGGGAQLGQKRRTVPGCLARDDPFRHSPHPPALSVRRPSKKSGAAHDLTHTRRSLGLSFSAVAVA